MMSAPSPAFRPLSTRGVRRRVAPFAGGIVFAFLLAALPPGPSHPGLAAAAAVLTVVTGVAVAFIPWQRLPAWTEVLPVVALLVVVAMVRHAEGGSASGFAALLLVPVFWTALYGTPHQLAFMASRCGGW